MIDWTITINTPIMIFVSGVAVGVIQRSIKKNRKQHQLTDIKVDALLHAVFISMNGIGEGARKEYEKRKSELMREKNFTDD
jgi:hypothetical protein